MIYNVFVGIYNADHKQKSARYFPRKMGFLGNNKELQSGTCNHGGSCASPPKQRGKSFTEGKRKLERVGCASTFILRYENFLFLAFLLHFKYGFHLLIFIIIFSNQ